MATVKKGDVGEAIVKRILESKGLIIYAPTQDSAHVVDFYAQYKGKALFAVEVKTYPRQYAFDRTGIDQGDYQTYLGLLAQGIDVVLFFVDEFERMVYQKRMSILKRFAQPNQRDGKVYFHLRAFEPVRRLTSNELRAIRENSATDYDLYAGTRKFWTPVPM